MIEKRTLDIVFLMYFIFLMLISGIYFICFYDINFAELYTVKLFIMILSVLLIVIYGIRINSIASSFCLMLPVIMTFNRPIFYWGNVLDLPYGYNPLITMNVVIVYFVFLMLFFIFFFRGQKLFPPIKYYLLLFILSGLSMLWTINKPMGFVYLNTILVFLLSFYIFNIFFHEDKDNMNYFIKGMFILCIIQGLFSWPEFFGYRWLLYFTPTQEYMSITGQVIRAGGTLGKSDLGMLLAGSIPFLFSISVFRRDISYIKKRILLLIIISFLITLAMTRYRSVLVATLIGMFIIYKKAISLRFLKPISVGKIVILFIILALIFYIFTFNAEKYEDLVFRKTWTGRLITYKIALQNLLQTKGRGVGGNNFLIYNAQSLGYNSWNVRLGKPIHNDYLKMSSELGILGLCLFVMFLYKFFSFKSSNSNAFPIIYGIKISILVLCFVALLDVPYSKMNVLIILGAYAAMLNNSYKITSVRL